MTYTESAALMQDPAFTGRIKVAVLKFADYIYLEPADTPAHTTRLKWATDAAKNSAMVANSIQPNVVMDSAVQEAGAEITDEALQGAVETTVNRSF